MSHAGWDEIWKLALAQLGAQPIELRILAGLALAFGALMLVEGLRVSFFVTGRSPARQSAPVEPQTRKKPAKKIAFAAGHSVQASPGPFRPRALLPANNPKRTNGHINRHSPIRPKIRRIPRDFTALTQPTFTEEEAPFSPLPPNAGRIAL